MAELIVIGYPDTATANKALDTLRALQKDLIVELTAAGVVERDAEGKLHSVTPTNAVSSGAAGGAVFGSLIGLLFLAPVAGAVFGAIGGALGGKIQDSGIKDDFKQQVDDLVEPGTAALVFTYAKATPDKTLDALAPLGGTVLRTSLSAEAEQKMQAALDAD